MIATFAGIEKLWIKKCHFCKSSNVQKYGIVNGVQRYKCRCNRQKFNIIIWDKWKKHIIYNEKFVIIYTLFIVFFREITLEMFKNKNT